MVLAMNAGMDSAIVDPTNKNMIGMIYATNALLEKDEYCLNYIAKFQEKPVQEEAAQTPGIPGDEKMRQSLKLPRTEKIKKSENVSRMLLTQVAILRRSLTRE